jgi:hypothetical protein
LVTKDAFSECAILTGMSASRNGVELHVLSSQPNSAAKEHGNGKASSPLEGWREGEEHCKA